MIHSIPRDTLVETLLNTLQAERYMRGPLLHTIVDELRGRDGLERAAEAARAILEALEAKQLPESEFEARVGALRRLAAVRPPPAASAA